LPSFIEIDPKVSSTELNPKFFCPKISSAEFNPEFFPKLYSIKLKFSVASRSNFFDFSNLSLIK
jgi:hypothetical protein